MILLVPTVGRLSRKCHGMPAAMISGFGGVVLERRGNQMPSRSLSFVPVVVSMVAIGSAQEGAFAGPLNSPGQEVIVSACRQPLTGPGFCNNGLTTNPGGWYVTFPTSPGNANTELQPLTDLEPPSGPHAAAMAEVATGSLKTSIVGGDSTSVSGAYATAEASIFDKVSFQYDGQAAGGDPAGAARVTFMVEGETVFRYQSVVSATFSIRDGSQSAVNPDNPDEPIAYLVYYSADWLWTGDLLSAVQYDPVLGDSAFQVIGLDNGQFGVSGYLPLEDLSGKPLEFSLWLYTRGTGDAVLDFWNTAELSLALPEGYSFTTGIGLLSARSGGPDGGVVGVAEPTSLALVLSGLLAFGMFRRAHH